jgi:hypothetical protein
LKVSCACPCRALDGWVSLSVALEWKASIKSYHEAMKCWFPFETKGLRGCYID